MPDREKIIQGIQECDLNGGKIGNCPYKGIIALLKEQEAVAPYVDGEGNYCCKECDTVVGWEELTNAGLTPYVYKFCPMCGRSVKWE